MRERQDTAAPPRGRRLPLSQTILAMSGATILCGLGTWQLQRLAWKNGIIATLEKDYAALDSGTSPFFTDAALRNMPAGGVPVAAARIHGQLLRDKYLLLGPRTEDGKPGYHLILPLALDAPQQPDADMPSEQTTLMVNAGWVPVQWQDDPQDWLAQLPSGKVTLSGILRKPDWNSFTSPNNPAHDIWLRADIPEMAAARGLSAPYEVMLYATEAEPPLAHVKMPDSRWLPRNKHLQYALFWYAMAVCLLGVFGLYARGDRSKP